MKILKATIQETLTIEYDIVFYRADTLPLDDEERFPHDTVLTDIVHELMAEYDYHVLGDERVVKTHGDREIRTAWYGEEGEDDE